MPLKEFERLNIDNSLLHNEHILMNITVDFLYIFHRSVFQIETRAMDTD
jgi:hypothetical protein